MADKPVHEGILLDESLTITLTELSELGQVEEKIVIEMVDHGILEPSGASMQQWVFSSRSITRVKKAIRLHDDLAINWEGISLALQLLDEVHELRKMVDNLKKN
jgi:chaperone modulatory protein CbpM